MFQFFEPSIFGMPQPMPFTRTCFWSNWSQWLRDPGRPSVLDYSPQKKGPMFLIFFNPAYLECPNLCLSPQPVFGRIGHNGSEIPISSKCAQLSPPPPRRGPMFQVFFEPSIFGMPQPMPLSRTCLWSNWSQWLRDPGPQSVLDYSPQKKGPMFLIFLNPAYLECPNLCLSPQPVLGRIGHNGSEIPISSKCAQLSPPPPRRGPKFQVFFEPSIFGMPQPMPFTRTCFWSNWSQWLKASLPPSVLHYPPPPKKRPRVSVFF